LLNFHNYRKLCGGLMPTPDAARVSLIFLTS
jgi:hypothetical protein